MDELADFIFDRGLAVMPAAQFAVLPEHRVHDGFKATPEMHPTVSGWSV
jgi:aromatic amino acid aminotransferase I